MKVTLINGYDKKNDLYEKCIENINRCLDKRGDTFNINDLSKLNIKNCMGCDSCQSIKPGLCAINDGVNEILKEYINSDIAIIITPIRFGTCNSITKKFIDRTEPLFLPYQTSKKGRTVMKNRYDRYPYVIVIGIADNTNESSIKAFRNTFMNCNLFVQGSEIKIEIIENELDLDKINFLE
ncbi:MULTISPECIES: flavodoxin family protein [Clostridium]|uniref:flavodoxin family protein n=1 Tax=Clostridium TaxID=1485 RepID=UPI000826E15F|nr:MULTISPECIES: flavodoxin family protein [Clostridium]PJI07617.1 flavodoxin family protein [Clostridium sp. CT7]